MEITHQTEANAWLSGFFYFYRINFQSDKILCNFQSDKILCKAEFGKCRGRKLDGPLRQPTVKAAWRILCSCVVNTVVSEWKTALQYLCLKSSQCHGCSMEMILCEMVISCKHDTAGWLWDISQAGSHQGMCKKSVREGIISPGLSLSGETVNSPVPSHTSVW